jgi:pyruvate/2-oxoglutarate dehydrogenase complex dihydrolipoamide acyltransferase (E2) component
VAYEFKLPDLGEGLTEGEIARWLVSEGQEIAEDEPLVEIQTDKTTVEIPGRNRPRCDRNGRGRSGRAAACRPRA